MTTKSIKYNQLKLTIDESSKTPKTSNMPLISSGYTTTSKRKILTRNFLTTASKACNPNTLDEKIPQFRSNITSSRSESRNKITKFNSSNSHIHSSTSSTHTNYASLLNKQSSNSNNDDIKTNNQINSNTFNISPSKAKKLNIFTNPSTSGTSNKHFHPLSTRANPLNKNTLQEPINIMTLLSNQNNIPLNISALKAPFPNYDCAKTSLKSMNLIRAYGVNTNQGIIRNYNEDRVSIILNILRPNTYKGDIWPKSSFFAIYDGHGGSLCSDYLRDNLHHFIIKDSNFPLNPKEAIRKGFQAAENEFLTNYALDSFGEIADRSGSCAIVCLIVDNTIYIANVGDSRAVMSSNHGVIVTSLSEDHKPNEENETKRISEAGGRVYQTQVPNINSYSLGVNNYINTNQLLLGPYRIFPGRLSVSRSFGDIEAKNPKFGGMANVLISTPDIKSVKLSEDIDFIVLGCDGIFDQMSNEEIVESVWLTTRESKMKNVHQQCGVGVDMIMKMSLVRRSLDNVTVVMIAFSNFERDFITKDNSIINKNKEVNFSNDFNSLNNNNEDSESFVKKSLHITKPSFEMNNKNYLMKKVSNDFKQSYEDQKKSFFENRTSDVHLDDKNELSQLNNDLKNINKTSSHENPRIPSSGRYKIHENQTKAIHNANNKKFPFLDNRKLIIKAQQQIKSEEHDDSNNNLYFSNKKTNLQATESIIEKLNTIPESTRTLKSKTDFFKMKSKLVVTKK